MSSKIIGGNSDFFAKMVVDAVTNVRREDPVTGKVRFPITAINILKSHGKSSLESQLVDGFALNCTRGSQAMPKVVSGAKIGLATSGP